MTSRKEVVVNAVCVHGWNLNEKKLNLPAK